MRDPRARLKQSILSLAAVAVLSGCVVGPEYMAPEMDLPDPSELALTADDLAEWDQWWSRFQDPTLDRLVERALSGNLDIRLQLARIAESRARLGLATAEQLPTIDAQAEGLRQKSPAAASPIAGASTTNNLFSIAGVLSYELDLWGRLAREREATEALLDQSRFGLEAVRLNVITDVASLYFALRAAERQLQITENTLVDRAETVRIEQIRFDLGQSDELVLRQAQAQLEFSRAAVPARREQVRLLEGALALLVGLSPGELFRELNFRGPPLESIALPEDVPRGLPTDLLQRRPDIRAAESNLMAAYARIGVAEASRLPRLSLAGVLGVASLDEGDLFSSDAQFWSAGASLLGPVFDFGRSRSRIETAEALRDQVEVLYLATVRIAFNEVRSALASYEAGIERVAAGRRQVEVLQRTADLSMTRYDEGLVSFIEVLDARRALLDAELSLAAAIQDHLTAAATLFKALGGGWDQGLRG